ncbi:hypothetical protein [Kitasatospora sp. A2-31]|uniref:hypothetical protein n=1 Tax=Kitasatospora sp. A2-31 TaxID=2916414 RepID=UPI001EEBB6D3|nr:hypothetical protein [Kitasatospora sp. A2-31]MCG6495706.1 hypothetical protein [Kitasatospora sp. A2-31]
MAQRRSSPRHRAYDFAAFVAVLATGVALVALGTSPESLAAVTIALSGLYSTWRLGAADRDAPPPATPAQQRPAREAATDRAEAPEITRSNP